MFPPSKNVKRRDQLHMSYKRSSGLRLAIQYYSKDITSWDLPCHATMQLILLVFSLEYFLTSVSCIHSWLRKLDPLNSVIL